jgi:hypothetical protein
MIARQGIDLTRKLFVAERNTSIFRRVALLIAKGKAIYVGGDHAGAIPATVFAEMISKFPNTIELNKYAQARVASVVGDYLDPTRDFRAEYEAYLSKRKARDDRTLPLPTLLVKTEIQKYQLIRDTISAWLKLGDQRTELDWQRMIVGFLPLIFPKYVAVLQNVRIEDRYSTPGQLRHRLLDLALVDANGHVDIIEVKRPFDDGLLRKGNYRDNHVPTADLSGTIMQAEKYLFHLAKWGVAGEETLTKRYSDQLPANMTLRITNPKAILIVGRDQTPDGDAALTPEALFDLEIIKRKYANMMDIITYDDLLRRLNRIIASLDRRSGTGFDLPDDDQEYDL